jgi:hypothetical protein
VCEEKQEKYKRGATRRKTKITIGNRTLRKLMRIEPLHSILGRRVRTSIEGGGGNSKENKGIYDGD